MPVIKTTCDRNREQIAFLSIRNGKNDAELEFFGIVKKKGVYERLNAILDLVLPPKEQRTNYDMEFTRNWLKNSIRNL